MYIRNKMRPIYGDIANSWDLQVSLPTKDMNNKLLDYFRTVHVSAIGS